ncbi:MAG: ABC transporter substrate-binding protein [Paracoccaceae bacterium]
MYLTLRKTLLASSVCAGALMSSAALAQDAVFVLNQSQVGVPTYNIIMTGNTNAGATMIYDTLVVQDADQSYHPGLAESWEEAADGMAWTFKLKSGVTFHNGEPFNAAKVVEWIGFYANGDNSYMTQSIEKAEAVDDTTVKLTMKNPDPNLLYNLSSSFMGVVEPKAFTEMGEDYGVTGAVGTGPFKFESFTIGSETVLVRNDDYTWGSSLAENKGPAKIERITLREIPEDSTAFLELKTGGVDMLMGVPNDFLGELAKEPTIATLTLPGQEVVYMPINVTKAPFDDIKVRQAAAFAINQPEILASVYGGVGSVANQFLISSLPESQVDPKYLISYDPVKSAALLDEAGWVMGADGVRAKDGVPLSVTLWTQSDSVFRRLSEVVQAELKAVGIASEITTFDSSTIRDQYKTGEQQLAVRSYYWNNADIVDWFFGGDRLGYPNVSMFNDPAAEALRVKAMTGSANQAERQANMKAYHEYVLSQFAMAPIYQPVQNIGYNKDRLKLPAEIHATSIEGQTMLSIEVIE